LVVLAKKMAVEVVPVQAAESVVPLLARAGRTTRAATVPLAWPDEQLAAAAPGVTGVTMSIVAATSVLIR
jgi:hypothetical protein